MIKTPSKCKECGSESLTWDTHYKSDSSVPEGRLRTSEVHCLFVLGCDECSETVAVVRAETAIKQWNEDLHASAEAGTALAEKDSLIGELQVQISRLKTGLGTDAWMATRNKIYLRLAQQVIDEHPYEWLGSDFDYEHPLISSIEKILKERDEFKAELDALKG